VNQLYTRALMPGLATCILAKSRGGGDLRGLTREDYITSTHRGHGHAWRRVRPRIGCSPSFSGKVDGYCRGKGGSMHIADPTTRQLGANAIVGGAWHCDGRGIFGEASWQRARSGFVFLAKGRWAGGAL